MTKAEAIAVIRDLGVSRETFPKLEELAHLVLVGNASQNLIAKSTEETIWGRHILDSAQLLDHIRDRERCWLDVGSGAGFPGLVLALLTQSEHVLVEPRRRRAEFLDQAARSLEVNQRVRVLQSAVEKIEHRQVGTVTARAVASIDKLLSATHHLADRSTTWLLHKGRSAGAEVDQAKALWNAEFEMLPSVTDSQSAIVRVTDLTGRRSR